MLRSLRFKVRGEQISFRHHHDKRWLTTFFFGHRQRGSIRRDRLPDEFKATLDESVSAREETLSHEPKSKLKMANEECRKLREKVKQLQAKLDRSVAREINLAHALMQIKNANVAQMK